MALSPERSAQKGTSTVSAAVLEPCDGARAGLTILFQLSIEVHGPVVYQGRTGKVPQRSFRAAEC